MKDSFWDKPGKIEELERLWAEGISTSEIGRRMGILKNAVVSKAHRLRLPGRPSPIKVVPDRPRVSASARSGAAGVGGFRVAPAARQSLAGSGGALPGPRAAATSAPLSSSLAKTSAAEASQPRPQLFVARGCQFPMWKHGERVAVEDIRFCEAKPLRNEEGRQISAYCEAHHARCFVKKAA